MREVAKRIVNFLPDFSTKLYFSIAKILSLSLIWLNNLSPAPYLGLNSIRTASIHLFSPL